MTVHVETTDKAGERHALDAARRGAARPEVAGSDAPGKTALLTAAQLAERWQVPVRTVYAWAKRNAVPHYRAGRLLRFDPVVWRSTSGGTASPTRSPPTPKGPGESAFALVSA